MARHEDEFFTTGEQWEQFDAMISQKPRSGMTEARDGEANRRRRAQALLASCPQVRLEQVELATSGSVHLPYTPATFDLITCTNDFHALPDPVGTLVELKRLLATGGQLVLEDIARRPPPFPWKVFERMMRLVVGRPVQVSTLAEARELAREAGLRLEYARAFRIDWLLHGWALRMNPEVS